MRILDLTEESRKNILEDLLKRSPSSYGKFEDAVSEIVNNVKKKGDEALLLIQRSLIRQSLARRMSS